MKRVICCSRCMISPSPYHEGEWFKRVRGSAKREMPCDWCGIDIKEGEDCAAESMGPDRLKHTYYEWEAEYLYL